jgi:phosphoribosylpyrophosphate synthetase
MAKAHGNVRILASPAHRELAFRICKRLNVRLDDTKIGKFANHETSIEIMNSVSVHGRPV